MNNIILKNARILTLDGGRDITEGEVWVSDGVIQYIGAPETAPENRNSYTEKDMTGKLIMPSFKDAHTHSAMTFLRSYADDLPLQEWLNNRVFPMEATLTDEDVYVFSTLAFAEYLTSGITADMDMYMHVDAFAQASIDAGFRSVIVDSINDFGGTVDEVEQSFKKFNSLHPLISHKLGFHAEYTTSPEIMRGIAELSQKYSAPVFTHACETKSEVEGCISRYGMTPIELFESYGMLNHGGGIYHGVWLTDNDTEILRKRGIYVVTNPSSNLKLASGIADIKTLTERGVKIAIGTDGAASNNALDMFREMFLVTALAKVKHMDAAAVPAGDVLEMACVNGARVMGLDDCACLKVGSRADLIALDLNTPNMQPLNSIVENIVYSGSKSNVYMTMIDGRILYENGEFATIDIERVYAEATRLMAAKR